MLISPGYFPNTYWPESYWSDDYWAEYGYVAPLGSWIDGVYVCEQLDGNVIWLKKVNPVAVETIRVVTANAVLSETDQVLVCDKATAMSVTLPDATASGKMFRVKSINTGVVTLTADTGDTIDGETTQPINRWDSISVVDYTSGKWVIV